MIGQPDFPYLAPGEKIARIEAYKKMRAELDKTRSLREMLATANPAKRAQLANSYDEFFSILEQLDSSSSPDIHSLPAFTRLEKARTVADSLTQEIFERFGVKDATFSTMDKVFDERVSGHKSLEDARAHLISKGMSSDVADRLQKLHLKRVEKDCHVYTLLDLFTDATARSHLNKASEDQLSYNYTVARTRISPF